VHNGLHWRLSIKCLQRPARAPVDRSKLETSAINLSLLALKIPWSAAGHHAGVARSAHGVRKIAVTRAVQNGAMVAQLEAIFGWKGGRMASLYTESADRRRLAIEAMGKLAEH